MFYKYAILITILLQFGESFQSDGVDSRYDRGGNGTNIWEITKTPSERFTSDELPEETQIQKCGVKKEGRQMKKFKKILTGQMTRPGDWPWHVAIYRPISGGPDEKYCCGGTLISKEFVVTAAHCTMDGASRTISTKSVYILLGKHDLNATESTSLHVNVSEIIVHPNFAKTNLANDIALMRFAHPITFTDYIQPICLPTRDEPKNDIFDMFGTTVGWGLNEFNTYNPKLTYANMKVVNDVDCILSNPGFFANFISENTFCAGNKNGTTVCNGDSGGGIYFSREDVWCLRGIVSLTVSRMHSNLCDEKEYTVFTNVVKYIDFLHQYVQQ